MVPALDNGFLLLVDSKRRKKEHNVSLKTYDIVEVRPDIYMVGRLRTRLFGLLRPKFEEYCPHLFASVRDVRVWIEKHEAWLKQVAHNERTFPRLIEFGYVPRDGMYRTLRSGGR